MKKLNFIKRDLNVNIWEAKTPLGTYRIMQIKLILDWVDND